MSEEIQGAGEREQTAAKRRFVTRRKAGIGFGGIALLGLLISLLGVV